MTDAARLFGAFGFSLVAALVATPVAMRVAARTTFYDHPVGYKGHARPTPYLGGAAVVLGFVIGAATFGASFGGLGPIFAGVLVLWVVGTIDDRVNVSPGARVAAEATAASLLWATGHSWDLFGSGLLDLVLTNLWVIGLVNAFNLMDNMDGAASSVASVSAAGAGVLALLHGQVGLAAAAFALSGSCVGFLPYNLRSPSRIFLGDGGSMPIGFVVAATVMAVTREAPLGTAALLASAVLVALPLLDTTLVVVSRRRRGVSVLTAGRDHLTHRLQTRLGSARSVAFALGGLQAALCAACVAATQLGSPTLIAGCAVLFVLGASAIGMLETDSWHPATAGEHADEGPAAATTTVERAVPVGRVELGLLGAGGLAAGTSAFFSGFYALSQWGPIGVGACALLVGLAVARVGGRLNRLSLAGLFSVAALCGWSALSAGWAESAESAGIEAGRWLLYLTLLWIFLMLARDMRAAKVVLGAVTAGFLAVAGYLLIRMLAGTGDSLFLGARLNGPLGYINGQASYLLLGFWPLVAAAERARAPALRGMALGGATLVAGLALMTQTRAVIPALAISVVVMVLVVPGRERRLWALVVVAAAIAATASPILDVYRLAAGAQPDPDVISHAARSLVVTAAAAGLLWGVVALVGRVGASFVLARRLALAGVLCAGLGVGLAAFGNPVQRVRDEAHAFTRLSGGSSTTPRFLSGAGNRYDYWRIAVDEFEADPLRGIGAGNFQRAYYAERATSENIRQPHSLELQTLAELGLGGGVALAVLLVAVFAGFGRVAVLGRRDPRYVGIAVAAGGIFLTWLVHTSVDWLHLLPGVTAAALAAAAVLLRLPGQGRAARPRHRVAIVLAATVALAGVLVIGRLALADRYRAEAAGLVGTNPARALADASTAHGLDGQSVPVLYVRAAAYARTNRYQDARATMLQAIDLEPHNFVTWALLGDLAVRRGDIAAAARAYGRAVELNPRDPALRALAQRPRSALGLSP